MSQALAKLNYWNVDGTDAPDSERLSFGPLGDTLPSAWVSAVAAPGHGFTAELALTFDGERVRADVLTQSRALSDLELQLAVSHAAEPACFPGGSAGVTPRAGQPLNDDELRIMAQLYCFHYAVGGFPRKVIAATWNMSPADVDRVLTKITSELIWPLPGRSAG